MSDKSSENSISASSGSLSAEGAMDFLLLEDRYWKRNAVWAGVGGTLIFHILVAAWLGANRFEVERAPVFNPYNSYEIELIAEPIEEAEESRFVTTNKGVAENVPDNLDNFGARNQQAAQEEAPDSIDPDNRPSSEGRFNRDSHESITGDLVPEGVAGGAPRFPQASDFMPPNSVQELTNQDLFDPGFQAPEASSSVDPVTEESLSEDGFAGSTVQGEERVGEIVDPFEVEEPVPVVEEEPLGDVSEIVEEVIDPIVEEEPSEIFEPIEETVPFDPILNPRPRPRVYRTADIAVRTNRAGVSRLGQSAVDAVQSIGGQYSERLFEAIDIRWDALAEGKDSHEINTMAKIRFDLYKNGMVENVEVLRSTMSSVGETLCKRAIVEGQPYEPWPDEMMHVFGDSREIVVYFYYDTEE
ncbi:MAG: hypothetical protein AAGB46_13050 [Verrucomicrobiota bacterium]